ncbi:hypothetical protein M426DRAFT_25724 [Hypoxylon sp. CI-4A]|nr:hypothetical protein M426DRAFT_25724 [Hypoxylon sp. CI-4A]
MSSPSKNKRKNRQKSDWNKKPRLGDGTSHTLHRTLWVERGFRRLRTSVVINSSNTFEYMPLEEKFGQDIRVLIIEPGKRKDPIRCKLVPSSITSIEDSKTEDYPFTALSYFWGEGDPIHEVYITSYETPDKKVEGPPIQRKNGHREWNASGIIHVRSNLFVALQRFRDRKEEKTMWIDALCVDQTNVEERSEQIQKMHELYLHAENVCIWLGDGTGADAPNPNGCFRFLRKMLDLKNLEDLFRKGAKADPDLIDNCVNIVRLMRNKWFSRRWIIQELALARNAEVAYGKSKMSWTDFADAIAIFIKNQDRIRYPLSRRYMETTAYLGHVPAVDGVKSLGANELVEFTNNIFRRSERGDIQQSMMTLEILVSSLLAFEAADPRDTIYAVLSLAKDTFHHKDNGYLVFNEKLSPDYKRKRLLDVYGDFIDYCISQSQSLDILLRHWAPTWEEGNRKKLFSQNGIPSEPGEIRDGQEVLPSWIPLIYKSSYGTPSQRILGRSNGDSLVGVSHRTGHKNYTATLDIKPEYIFSFKPPSEQAGTISRVFDGRLLIKGLRVGTVRKLTPRASRAMISRETLQMAGFDPKRWTEHREWAKGVPRVPERFWRTIVADRGPDGSNPPSWYPRACMDCLSHLSPGGDLEPDSVISFPKASGIAKDFLQRVKDVTWERRFAQVNLEGQDKNTYGLLPPETRKRDIVCVLFGASVPVVLREQNKDGKRQFIMVGECFIYGMMEGEAVSDTPQDSEVLDQGSGT